MALLMVPVVMLTAEEAMKMVPRIMKDAAHGIGCTHTQVITKVVVPTAMPGIITGVILAVARAAGETAPLLFTALFAVLAHPGGEALPHEADGLAGGPHLQFFRHAL